MHKPHRELTDDEWAMAEEIADDLEQRDFICGHPYREDVESVIRALIRAGYIIRVQSC